MGPAPGGFDGSTAAETVSFRAAGRDDGIGLLEEHRAEPDAIMAELQDGLKKFTDVCRQRGKKG